MSNIFTCDDDANKIYNHSGFSTTISSSITSPSGNPEGLSWGADGNLYSCDRGPLKGYRHNAFTTTITNSFTTPSTSPRGISWRNSQSELYTIDRDADKVYQHTGFTSTINSSISSPASGPDDVSWGADNNLYSSDDISFKIYKHSGFTTTVTNSFSAPSSDPSGLSWDNVNNDLYIVDEQINKIYVQLGFTSTVDSSISAPSTQTTGVEWEGREQSILAIEYSGIANTTFNGSVSIEIHKDFDGIVNFIFDGITSLEIHKTFDNTTNILFDGGLVINGGVTFFQGSSDASFKGAAEILGVLRAFVATAVASFDGSAEILGELRAFDGLANTHFDGVLEPIISQKLFSSDAGGAVFGGSVLMEVSDFSFKWSLDNLEARTDYGFPTVYVDLDKDAIPVGAFPEGDFYERRLLQMPRLQEVELDTRFGISGFQRVTFTVDNSDRLISGLDLQDSFVRMLFIDENGSVYKDFKGKVVDWTLSHQVTINVEDIEALAFTQDLPKRTLNDVIEGEKAALSGDPLTEFTSSVVADDLGKPIPIIFGRAIKVPLLYMKADETLIQPTQESKREYDYIIGEGTGLNNKYFKEVFTVYRDDQALDNFAGPQQGIAQGGNFNSITLDADHERPDGWFKYFWIFITSGHASGDIKFVESYNNNVVTPDSSFSGNVNSGDTYELREWRFFDGSQASPYPGYAFLRFKKRMGDRGRTEPLYADVNGLQDEVNVVRAVESILTNSNWGFDLKVNTSSFDAAAGLPEIGQMKCEGGILNTTSAGDLLRELLGFRDMVLTKIE